MKTIVKGLIGMEDLSQGIGSFSRSTSTGGTQALSKVPLAVDSAGGLSVSTLNRVLYVGEAFATLWGSSDIGAQINAAYAALPTTYGGEIRIAQKVDGSAYTYTTPIVLSTSGKYVRLVGEGVGCQNAALGVAASVGGVVLNYTPTSGTAISIDYVPSGGGGIASNHGLFNFDLVGGAITSLQNGGPGVSTNVGISFGGTHSGMQNGTMRNVRIVGFSVGLQYPDGGATQSWGITSYNCSWSANTTGINIQDAGIESARFFGCQWTVNGTGIASDSNKFTNSDFHYFGCSFDSNTTWGINTSGGGLHSFNACHFENLGNTTVHYIQSDGRIQLNGGCMLDNVATSSTDKWISLLTGGTIHVFGTQIFSGGRTSTTFIAAGSPANIRFDGLLLSSTFTNTTTGGTVYADTGINSVTPNYFNSLNSKRIGMHNATALQTSDFSLSAGWGNTATVTAVAGTDQGYKITITAGGSGITASPTVNHTYKDGAFPGTPVFIAQLYGGTGVSDSNMNIFAPVSGTSSTLWTAGGTPTNGHTYVYNVIGLGN